MEIEFSSSADCEMEHQTSCDSFDVTDCVMAELPYSVETNETLGRHLVAQRNIEQGEMIISEKPLVHGLSRDSCMACFGCYGELDAEDTFCCNFCGLPLCSESCQTAEQHRIGECEALTSIEGNQEAKRVSLELLDDIPLLHDVVLVLRCLAIRQNDPNAWAGFLQMQPHLEARKDSDLTERAIKVAEIILAEFSHLSVDTELILKIMAILDINSFEIPSMDATVQALYSTGCLLEHNCIPNGHRIFGPDISICVRAAVAIPAGEHISITYTDSLWPTAERRSHLIYSKHFSCACNRCKDPSENQTFLGAIRCLKCPVGHYLPIDPLNDDFDWKCDTCDTTVAASYATHVNSEIGQSIKVMEEAGLEPETCEKFLLVNSRVLHSQHAHMMDVKHSLMHLLGHHEGYLMADLNDKHLQYKEEIARTILSVADKILPGISRLRGTTLYELFHTYQQRGLNWYKNNRRSPKDILSAFRTAESCLRQCIETLQYESTHRAEGKLVSRAREELQMLIDFIPSLEPTE